MRKICGLIWLVLGLSQSAMAFTVTGNLTYEKRVYSVTNGAGTVSDVVLGNVTIVANNGVTTTTNSAGAFSISLSDGGTYSLKVRSMNDQFTVGSSLGAYYEVEIASGIKGGQHVAKTVTEAEKSGAFNILVQLQRGVDWVVAKGQTFSRSRVSVRWPDSNSYFDPEGRYLVFLGSVSDPDEFDDDVILHEFGHLVMDVLSVDHSAGGQHSITDNDLDLRLAWSEGIATWISCAIQNDDRYMDSNGTSLGISYLINDAPNNNSARTSANEWAVSYLIWNASKNVGSVENVLAVLASFKGLSEQISLDSFYDQWTKIVGSSLVNYIKEMEMSYVIDNDEDNSTATPFDMRVVGSTETRSALTFFGKNDEDIYKITPISGQIFSVTTSSCKNGALTQLEVYKGIISTGNLIASNAQANNAQKNANSFLTISATDNTPLFVKVNRFNSATANYGFGSHANLYNKTVGHYGNYKLSIANSGLAPSLSVSAGQDVVVIPNKFVTLTASENNFSRQSSILYTWTQVSGPSVTVENNNSMSASIFPTVEGEYVFNVQADYDGLTDSDNVKVVVNSSPIAQVQADKFVNLGDHVLLDGSSSSDPNQRTLSTTWSQVSGSTVSLMNSNSSVASFIATIPGKYIFSLNVNNGLSSSSNSTIITVLNMAPTIQKITLSSNTGFYNSNIDIAITASDRDGSVQTYLYDTNNDGQTDMESSSSNINLNFIKGNHRVAVKVVDNFGVTSAVFISDNIEILNSAPVASAGPDRSGGSNLLLKAQATAADGDIQDALTYTWSQVSGSNINITEAGNSTLSITPTLEGSYVFTVSVSDGNSIVSDNVTFTILDLFAGVSNVSASDNEVTALTSLTVNSNEDVATVLESAYQLAQKKLTVTQRSNTIAALSNALNIGNGLSLDASQISQILGALDNVVDESLSAGNVDKLSSSELDELSNGLSKIFDLGSGLNSDQIAKAYEVLSEILGQQKDVSGNSILESSLSNTQQSSFGVLAKRTSQASVKALTSGSSKQLDQEHLHLRASALANVTSSTTIGDNTQGYAVKLPAGFSNTAIAVSALKMNANPHKGLATSGVVPVGSIVAFDVTTLGTENAFSFNNTIELTIPIPNSLGAGKTFTPRFFDETELKWSSDGISNVVLNFDLHTARFNVTHLTDFAVTEDALPTITGSFGGGGGCLLR